MDAHEIAMAFADSIAGRFEDRSTDPHLWFDVYFAIAP